MSINRVLFNSKMRVSRILMVFCVILLMQPSSFSQEKESYLIGIGDRLSITFWQQPDLDSEVRVGDSGIITLPVIGEIKAQGLTTSELSKKIVEQMSFYNTPISQATVVVTEFNSRVIVVTGQVVTPASKSYERIPDLWQVILDAGGPTADADLSRVTVVRKEGAKSDVIDVDLYKIIKDGDLTKAPQLRPGDLVNVPLSPYGPALTLTGQPKFEGKNIYFIFGQVTAPGAKNLEAGLDVLDAISLANGTTAEADLRNVRVVMKDAKYSNIVKIDLQKYIETGTPPRLTLHPEDTIIIPARRTDIFSSSLSILSTVVPLVSAMGTLYLLWNQDR